MNAPPTVVLSMNFSYVKNAGGVIDFGRNLAKGLAKLLPQERLEIVSPRESGAGTTYSLARFLSDVLLDIRCSRRRCVVIYPNYFLFPTPFALSKRVVVIHDLQFRELPQYWSRKKLWFMHLCYRLVARHADAVVFISESTRQDFVRHYGEPRRAFVVYNPIEMAWPAQAGAGSESDYFFSNFHNYPHKNVGGVLDFFAAYRQSHPGVRLIFTGHRSPDFDDELARRQLTGVVEHRGFIDKAEVHRLLMGAKAFISMSLFEGFNMSAAEAALSGIPVVLSDIPVHREIFARVAYLVDTTSVPAYAAGLDDYLTAWPTLDHNRFREGLRASDSYQAYLQIVKSLID